MQLLLVKATHRNCSTSSLIYPGESFFVNKIRLTQEKNDHLSVSVKDPVIDICLPKAELKTFRPVSVNKIAKIILKSSNACCQLDPIPTSLLKQYTGILAPVITQMVNLSLYHSIVPGDWKCAIVSPLLKKWALSMLFPTTDR